MRVLIDVGCNAALLVLLAGHSASAQAPLTPAMLPPPRTVVRLRLRGENTRRRGTVVRTVDDSIWVASCQSCASEPFWLGDVAVLERRASRGGRAGRVWKGIGIGSLAGAGIIVGAVKQCESGSGGHSDGPPCAIGYIILGPPILAAGAIVGGLVGAAWPSGEWITVWPSTGANPTREMSLPPT